MTKNNQKVKKWYKIEQKWAGINFLKQNRKKCKTQNFAARMKNDQSSKKMFLMKILTKIDFRERILIFQRHPSTQNIKNMVVNNMALIWWPEIQKHIDLFCIFLVPVRTIRHDPSIELDLSCPELFFRIHCGSYSVPNGLICFGSFFCIFAIFVDFH